jgi:hypothetical protein
MTETNNRKVRANRSELYTSWGGLCLSRACDISPHDVASWLAGYGAVMTTLVWFPLMSSTVIVTG